MNPGNREKLYLPLLIMTGVLIFIGMVLIFSASRVIGQSLSTLFVRQIIWAAIGFAALAWLARIDFHFWIRNSGFLYFINEGIKPRARNFGERVVAHICPFYLL